MFSSKEKGYLAKQGISFEDHKANMIALSDFDKMEFQTLYNWNVPVEVLIASEQRSLNYLISINDSEGILRLEKQIAYLSSLKPKQLSLVGVA